MTWAEAEDYASISTRTDMRAHVCTLQCNHHFFGSHCHLMSGNFKRYMYRKVPVYSEANFEAKASISADLFCYRMGLDDHVIDNIYWGYCSSWTHGYLLDRLTDLECVQVETNLRMRQHNPLRGFTRVLSARTRTTVALSSLGQLPLPAVLVQHIAQFCSEAITPARPVALRPPSYLARVAAIRTEIPVTGEARAASQMAQLEEDTRGGKRARI